MDSAGLDVIEMPPRLAKRNELQRVHSLQYLDEVLNGHVTSQWLGERRDLSELATLFAGGTLVALELLLEGKTQTAIHFPGAKHHAQFDHSSGFCVFADFAMAADFASKDFGKRVAILDIDAHHGDGTENLTLDNSKILTYSIHESGIFPGTGNVDFPEKYAFNSALESFSNDFQLISAVRRFIDLSIDFQPDIIFIACGADGHSKDPLSSLQYTVEGFVEVANLLRTSYPTLPMLIGGAGGYLPDTYTPEVWANFATTIAQS